MPVSYDHLVEIDEEKRQVVIYRVLETGKKQLYTSTELPEKTFAEDQEGFKRFAQMLGENLLVDSPRARSILGLD